MTYKFGSLVLISVLSVQTAFAQQAPSSQTSATSPTPTSPPRRSIAISIPADFSPDTVQAAATAAVLNTETHLGGLAFEGSVEAQRREVGPVLVFITSLRSKEKVAYPDVAIHSEFEQLRTAPTRGSMDDDEIDVLSWQTELVGGSASARSHWRHNTLQTETRTRALAFRVPSGHLHYVQVECLYPIGDANIAARAGTVCAGILDSMAKPEDGGNAGTPATTGTPEHPAPDARAPVASSATVDGNRAPTGKPLSGTLKRPTTLPPMPERPGAPADGRQAQDATHLGPNPQPIVTAPRKKKRDYRTILVILGGALLVLGFYLSTRSRNAPIPEDEDDT